MHKPQGFTLIELLVVVSIIGLLATLAVVSFNNAQTRARDSKRIADIRVLVSAFSYAAVDDSTLVLCQDGCTAGAISGITPVSLVDVCTACGAGGVVRTNQYLNISNVKDPRNAGACGAVPPVATCDYSFSSTSTISSFTIGFTTEGGTASAPPPGLSLANGNFHWANQQGVVR